ncbi:MAG: ATP-binding protein [Burkholderiales bacterium]|nr:ATP-binding protein [Burkholderiales bacterium]
MKKINIIFFTVILTLIMFSYFYVTIYSKYDVMLYLNDYRKIIQLNKVIEAILLFIIFGFVYRLFFRKNNAFGSILTKKLFILLSIVILIPSLINIKIANYFIDNTVNRLFNPQIEQLLDNSFNIAEESIKYFSKELRKKSVIAGEYLKLTDKDESKSEIAKVRKMLDVDGISIYNNKGNLLVQDNDKKYLNDELEDFIVAKIKKVGYFYEINKSKGGDYIFNYYQYYNDGKIVALSQIAPEFIKIDNNNILHNKELYQGLLNNKDNLKDVYTSTLIISVLLSITIAVLLTLFFAQFLIKRISSLIENIESIKKGSYSNQNIFKGNDELSQLIHSFNDMGHSLEESQKIEKKQKLELTEYKNYLENIINNLSLSVIVYDDKYVIKNVNLITQDILNIEINDILNINIDKWDNSYKHLEGLIKLIKTKLEYELNEWEENIVFRYKHYIKNLYVKTIRYEINGSIEYITLISDVTNLIIARQNQAWADIAKRLAHEIKNPLTPIVLSAERIQMKLVPKLIEKDQEFLNRLVNQIILQVDDLKELVNKFRDFANISKPHLVRLNLVEFFNQFMILYENMSFIKLIHNLPENKSFVLGDQSLLRQVFHNLVKNSIESVENNENKDVKITLTCTENVMNILVSDNGHGFSENIMNNLFEPYQTTKGVKGSGLGMAIVKKIIDEHHGKIEVFNDDGANIVVKLPLTVSNVEFDRL